MSKPDFKKVLDMKYGINPKDYEKHHSHTHCWTSKSPPCGQKIKHFECCLCKEPNPDIYIKELK